MQKRQKGPRVNREIQANIVFVIKDKGEKVGRLSLEDAIRMANEEGLDLVEVSPNADPPVCKITDLGKYKYEDQKKKKVVVSRAKKMKEIVFSISIDSNDFDTKVNHAKRFLKDGHSVRIVIRMKGRELSHSDVAYGIMEKIISCISDISKIQEKPQRSGGRVSATFVPEAAKVPVKPKD